VDCAERERRIRVSAHRLIWRCLDLRTGSRSWEGRCEGSVSVRREASERDQRGRKAMGSGGSFGAIIVGRRRKGGGCMCTLQVL
jgi:hypothetical protein